MLLAFVVPLAAETVRTTGRLNLRQEPSTASLKIGLLEAEAQLEVISRRGLWIRVRSELGEGWVHSDYVAGGEPAAEAAPEHELRDAELARDVALLRVRELEKQLEARGLKPVDEVAQLRAQLAERERQIAELVDEIAGRGSAPAAGGDDLPELTSVLEERDDLADRLAEARTQLEGLRDAQTRREGEVQAELEARGLAIVRLESALGEARAALAQCRETVATLERRLAAPEPSVAEAGPEELAEARNERDRMAVQVRELEARLAAVEAESGREGSDLRSRLAAAESELAAIRAARDGKAAEVEGLTTEGRRLASALLELQEWSVEAEALVETLSASNRELEQQVAALKGRRGRSGEPERVALGEALANARSALQRERLAAEEATARAARLRSQLAQAEQRESASTTARAIALRELDESALRVQELRLEVARLTAIEALRSWARAWERQDAAAYLAAFDPEFEPVGGETRANWEAGQRRRLAAPSYISVTLENVEASVAAPGRLHVSFDQIYRSDTSIERRRRAFELATGVDGGWKIRREIAP